MLPCCITFKGWNMFIYKNTVYWALPVSHIKRNSIGLNILTSQLYIKGGKYLFYIVIILEDTIFAKVFILHN